MVSFWVCEIDLVVFGMRLGGKFLGMRKRLGRFGDAKLTWSFLGCGSVVSFLVCEIDLVVLAMRKRLGHFRDAGRW